jgi:hypothetical protein
MKFRGEPEGRILKMKKITRRRTEIKIETHEIQITRVQSGGHLSFCGHCRSMTVTFTPDQIADCFQISLREVCREIESGRFHLTETERGLARVCGASLRPR